MNPSTKVIFDYYVNRPQYHFVERLFKPIEPRGRQALFEIPTIQSWDEESLELATEACRFNLNHKIVLLKCKYFSGKREVE